METTELKAAVRRIFDLAGDAIRPVALLRREPQDYDPALAGPGAVVEHSTAGRAHVEAKWNGGDAEGLEVRPGEAVLWLADVVFAPRPGDLVTIDGVTRRVRRVANIAGAGVLFVVVAG